MTDAQKLELIQTLSGETDVSMLTAYLIVAGDYIIQKAYPMETGITEVPDQYGVLQCRIAAYLLQRRGSEGEKSHSENGYSVSFEDGDIPPSLSRLITPFAFVPGFVRIGQNEGAAP